MEYLFYILFFVIISVLSLCTIIPIFKRHHKTTGAIINYNATMSKYVYKVNMKSDDIIEKLKCKNIDDELSCTIDLANSVMIFSDDNDTREYHYCIQESSDYSVLKLEKVSLISMKSQIPYKLNPYMVRKLHAEMLPYSDNSF